MNILRPVVLILFLCCLSLPTMGHAESTQEVNRARLNFLIKHLNETKTEKLPDTEFQFNPGFDGTKKIAEVMGFEDYTPEKYLEEYRLHPEEKKFNQLYEEKTATRKEYLNSVDEKNRAFSKAERNLAAKKEAATRKLEDIEKQASRRNGYQSKRQQRKVRQQTRIINDVNAQQHKIRVQKAELQRAKRLENYTRLRNKIQASGNKITKMQNSLRTKGKVDNALFLVKVALTGLNAEAEENYRAKQEGRQPLAINKVIIFTKGMTGYAAVEGLVTSTQVAHHEALKEAAEYYRDLDLEDVSFEELERRVTGFANRAAARTAIYEGAKLIPVVGDAINTKEIFDAGFDARVAVEEANYTISNNVEAQFQTSLRAAVNVETKARQMESIAERAKLLTASLNKLKGQLLAMEQNASANRDQVKQAINILDAYNEQAAALSNPAIVKNLDSNNLESLLGRLKGVRVSAEEQIGNMQRVKSEHQSGQLTAQGVATQTKFIGDLLQPTVADYKGLQPVLANISAISQGAELAAQVPQALELIRLAKPIMQKDGEHAAELYEAYREQAGNLEQLASQFKELRGEMPRYLAYLQSSKNLEESHQDKIRAALDRANSIDIDQTALRRAIEDARGLRSNMEMVGALANLDKTPKTVNTAQVEALVQQARQGWAKLSGPNQAAAESLKKAQGLLNELVALAGDAKPTTVETRPEPSEKVVPEKAVTSQGNQEPRVKKAPPKPAAQPVKNTSKTQPAGPKWVKSFKGSFPAGEVSFPYAWGAFSSRVFEQLTKTHTVDLPGPGYVVIWIKTSKTLRRNKNSLDPGMLDYNRTELHITDCSSMGKPPWRGSKNEILIPGRITFYFTPRLDSLGSKGDMINYKIEPGSYELLIKWFEEKPPDMKWDGK